MTLASPGRLLAATLTAAVLALPVAGCSASSGDDASGGSAESATEPRAAAADADAFAGDASAADGSAGGGSADRATGEVGRPAPAALARQLISTGTVALRSADVARTRADVQEVLDRARGEVAQEQTDTDEDGRVRRTHLVLRVPSAAFARTMDELEGTATLASSDRRTKDVTTEVIDTRTRVAVQRRSIARVQQLLGRAESIRDIVSIEAQLSSRQADLDSLEQQQAYLADQTSLSTIAVSVQLDEPGAREPDDGSGFLAGLAGGWDALATVAVGAATALGALLPFAVVALVLAVPGVPLLRRLRRRRVQAGAAGSAG